MDTIWAALAGMIVYLDTTAIAQLMISQPLIACPLWGFMVGRPEIGLFFGITFQLIWLGNLQIGAAKFPEGNIGAFIATALAARVAPQSNGEPAWIVLAIALVVGVFASHVGRELAPFVRRIIGRIVPGFVDAAAAGKAGRMRSLFLVSVGIHAAAGFLFCAMFYLLGKGAFTLAFGKFYQAGISAAITAATDSLLSGIWPGLLGAGAAVATLLLVKKSALPVYLIAAVAVAAGGWLWLS